MTLGNGNAAVDNHYSLTQPGVSQHPVPPFRTGSTGAKPGEHLIQSKTQLSERAPPSAKSTSPKTQASTTPPTTGSGLSTDQREEVSGHSDVGAEVRISVGICPESHASKSLAA